MAADAQLLKNLENPGWEVVSIFRDETGPPFAFTLGLFHSFQHPEILMMGPPLTTLQAILHGMAHAVKSGARYNDGDLDLKSIENFKLTFRRIDTRNYFDYLGTAVGFYENVDFPTLQCFWPDAKGLFPWEPGFEKRLLPAQAPLYAAPDKNGDLRILD